MAVILSVTSIVLQPQFREMVDLCRITPSTDGYITNWLSLSSINYMYRGYINPVW